MTVLDCACGGGVRCWECGLARASASIVCRHVGVDVEDEDVYPLMMVMVSRRRWSVNRAGLGKRVLSRVTLKLDLARSCILSMLKQTFLIVISPPMPVSKRCLFDLEVTQHAGHSATPAFSHVRR